MQALPSSYSPTRKYFQTAHAKAPDDEHDAQKTHAPAHVEAGQAFDPALFEELAPTADRVVIQQQSDGDFSAAPPRVQQNQSVGPARHARRRRPIARQRDQLFAILFAKQAASIISQSESAKPRNARNFSRFFNESGYTGL
jgi:hypothetical protein